MEVLLRSLSNQVKKNVIWFIFHESVEKMHITLMSGCCVLRLSQEAISLA